jgi:hypothetical protein
MDISKASDKSVQSNSIFGDQECENGGVTASPPSFALTASACAPASGPGGWFSAQARSSPNAGQQKFPWWGEIDNTPLAALRSSTSLDPNNPHQNTIADLPRGTQVKVVGRSGGWLKVEVKLKGKSMVGFVSQELVVEFEEEEEIIVVGKPEKINEAEIDLEIRTMLGQMSMRSSPSVQGSTNGAGKVTPDVGLKILENVSRGQAPFKPELGKGGASWFITEGNPYVGALEGKSVDVNVDLKGMKDAIIFDDARLEEMFESTKSQVAAEAEAEFRRRKGLTPSESLNRKNRVSLERFIKAFAESRMWDKVGELVGKSKSRIGEVILKAGSKFSKTAGKFAVVADASKMSLKGGLGPLIASLKQAGVTADPVVVSASQEWARQKNVGRVQTVFKWGGRLLIVVGIAADGYKIYRAENKLKETAKVVGGWGGAALFSAAFATWFAPADVAGPGAWVIHGVGTLVAGGVGYFVGSNTTQYLYELVVEE